MQRFFPTDSRNDLWYSLYPPTEDGQAEWAWVAQINTGMVDPPKVVTNPSTNHARRSFLLHGCRYQRMHREQRRLRYARDLRQQWRQFRMHVPLRIRRRRIHLQRWPTYTVVVKSGHWLITVWTPWALHGTIDFGRFLVLLAWEH